MKTFYIIFLYLKADDDEENPFGDDFGDNVVSFQVKTVNIYIIIVFKIRNDYGAVVSGPLCIMIMYMY